MNAQTAINAYFSNVIWYESRNEQQNEMCDKSQFTLAIFHQQRTSTLSMVNNLSVR